MAEDLRCGSYPGDAENRAVQFGWQNFDRPACATIIQGLRTEPRAVLEYGESVTFSPQPDLSITCSSTQEGIRCENPNGYGFFVSKTDFTRYRV
ncbi:hypothetical protein [Gordonia alkaliphila]|uniref:hypothetical protein n=1 Tax=Gordonia alkaliphila TaxID=1053547 RepID=UPI0031EE2EA1